MKLDIGNGADLRKKTYVLSYASVSRAKLNEPTSRHQSALPVQIIRNRRYANLSFALLVPFLSFFPLPLRLIPA